MFWGLVLEPYKKYTQKVDQTFHISQAALDLESPEPTGPTGPIQLIVEYENSSFLLATLSKVSKIFQVPLDLIFKTGDEISFRTTGHGKVHLSGYHVLEDIDSMIMNGEEESDIDELETFKIKGKRRKSTLNTKKNKKTKLNETNEEESEDYELAEDELFDEEDGESEDDEKNIFAMKVEKKKPKGNSSFPSMDEDDAEDSDSDDDNDDNDDDEEEDEDDEDDDCQDEDDEDEDGEEMDFDEISDEFDNFSSEQDDHKKGKMNKFKIKKGTTTPNGLASSTKGKEKSPQNLKKSMKQGTPKKEEKTPKSETKMKCEKKFGSADNTPLQKNVDSLKKKEKSPKSPKSEGSPQKKVLEGGVISEEIKVGNGPVAKPGKMANVYYVGTLASTKKEFDSVQSGGGFKFRIGRNEVIKGWDIGINGMKVGGKRKLTIPAHLAYGSRGSPPVIPPNSTLVFVVELKGLS